MSEFWVKKMKRYFNVMDIDGDGVITKRDFEMLGERVCDNENADPARREKIRKSFGKLWQNYSKLAGSEENQLTESVFIESIKSQRNNKDLKSNLTEACRSFLGVLDTNEDGFLQEDEYRRLFESTGLADVSSYAKIAFNAIDSNHDGKLSIDEFTTAHLDFLLSEDEKSPFQFFFGPLE